MTPRSKTDDHFDGQTIFTEIRVVLDLLRHAPSRGPLLFLACLIIAVIILNAIAQIRLNSWQGSFYDALSNRNLEAFYTQLGVFGILVAVLLTLNVSQTWFHELLKVRFREALSIDLISEWLRPMRIYRLPLLGEIGVNPDQRIQDDAHRFIDLSVDLGVGLFNSMLLLVSFVGVLWGLSQQVVFNVSGTSFTIPGYMVWCAIAYALIGSFLTWLVGRPLIVANTILRQREGDFRFLLVRANESGEAIAVQRGEVDERKDLEVSLGRVLQMMREIANDLARLTWVTAGYGWIGLIAPILVAAPGYFGGTLSFGGLMMVSGAFFQVQQSLRWFVDRFPGLAEWRATLHRVIAYRTALTQIETAGLDCSRIEYAGHPDDRVSIDGLCVFAQHGRITLSEEHIELASGERVLLGGTPAAGRSTVFRALAGLWIWGEGKVRLPHSHSLMFLPHRPYMPLGTLREALTYPHPPHTYDSDDLTAALNRFELERLVPDLDSEERWDRELTLDEQQRIAFARALLLKPAWIIQDEAITELDDQSRRLVESVLGEELAQTAVISVGRGTERGTFYDRVINLQSEPGGLPFPLPYGVSAAKQDNGAETGDV